MYMNNQIFLRHIEKALAGFDKATPLARSIALKEKRPSLGK